MFKIIDAPMLDIDNEMLKRFGNVVSDNGILERKIVANVLQYCIDNDFNLTCVNDGFEITTINNLKDALELIFNLDEAYVYVKKHRYHKHCIKFSVGEGEDIFADFSFYENDDDGFQKLMDCFDVEKIS